MNLVIPNNLGSLIVAISIAWCMPSWSASTSRVEQKRQAESEHSELRKKLGELKQEILNTESAKNRAEDALAGSEVAISNTNRKLVNLSKEQKQFEQQLAELTQQQHQLQQRVAQQKEQLSKLLLQQYKTGSADRIKLLLSGDNPNRINRDLNYLGYLSQEQQSLINQLRHNLAAVEANKLATEEAKKGLDDIASEQQQQKLNLVKEKTKRAELLKQLSNKLGSQRKEAGQLQKNEQRLASLVQKLNLLIEEQRKATQLRQEKRRAAALAKEKAEKASRDASVAPTGSTNQTKPIQITQTPETSSDGDFDDIQFAKLKGRLRAPVKGQLTAKYGSQRGEGTVWKGVFIRANEGDNIKSIAPGKVIFAEWLRGFGNLIILDHGAGYMSIYGNNQALLKQAGDSINTGDVIATVGNSGGNEQSGLYFELRYQGKAFNPFGWMNFN